MSVELRVLHERESAHVGIDEVLAIVLFALAPVDEMVLGEERRYDHTAAVMHICHISS